MLITVPVLAACQSAPESTMERAQREGFLRVAYSEEPPYAFLDESTGRVGGESPEALRAVVEELGIEDIRWVRLDFGDLIPSLLEGRVDVVAAGMFRTPEREDKVSFSIPTVCSGPALLVPHGSQLRSMMDFTQDTSLRIAVLHGSVEYSAAQALGIEEDRLLPVPDLTTAIVAVDDGSADAFAITLLTARRAVQNRPSASLEVRRYDPPFEVRMMLSGCSALVLRRDETTWVEAVNAALREYVGFSRHVAVLSALGLGQENIPLAPQPQ